MRSKRDKRRQLQRSEVKRRTVTGCLTCRKRKKKCDEAKPVCSGCSRNFLECKWSYGANDRLQDGHRPCFFSREAEQRLIDKRKTTGQNVEFNLSLCRNVEFLKYNHRTKWKFDIIIADPVSGTYRTDSCTESLIEQSDSISGNELSSISCQLNHSQTSEDQKFGLLPLLDSAVEHLDLQVDSYPRIDIPTDALVTCFPNSGSHYLALIDSNDTDSQVYESLFRRCKNGDPITDLEFEGVDMQLFLFYACVKGYVPKMTTQYTHSSLTTAAAFIPQVEKNPIMREVFLCCGATYLAWKNLQRFQSISDELYITCKTKIQNFIENNDNFADEDWLFGALQLLCNRDKNSLTGTTDDAAWHLVRAFDIIRIRYYNNGSYGFEHSIIDKLANPNLILHPQERILIESFLFQFSVSILFVQNLRGLPNPFKIFKTLNVVLKCPVYNCDYESDWMNNPVLGSSLDSFEILAKLSFIARMPMPLRKEPLAHVAQLRHLCNYYTPATPSRKIDDVHWHNFKVNSRVGLITARTCGIFADKIFQFDAFQVQDSTVQESVKYILECYRKIPTGHAVWGILPWSILVIGVFTIRSNDQAFILELIEMMAERTHSYNGHKISAFLRKAWASENAPMFLFDHKYLTHVSM